MKTILQHQAEVFDFLNHSIRKPSGEQIREMYASSENYDEFFEKATDAGIDEEEAGMWYDEMTHDLAH